MTLPLEGIRVLDLSRVLAGPWCTMHLADLGADVVKVERPGTGDDTRSFGPPFVRGTSTYFLAVNRGKRSIVLDLKSERGRALLRRLARVADVLVENFRPGVMARLGLGPDALLADNPRLVYCTISGFGADDPRPGYDLVAQAASGIPSLTGPEDGGPYKCGASIADLVAGSNAVQAILAALLRRERTGRGGSIDVPMLDGQLALLTYHASAWLNAGAAPRRLGNAHPSIHPFRIYEAADAHFSVAVGNDALWRAFCRAVGLDDLSDDPRFRANRDRVLRRVELDAILEPLFRGRPAAHWLDRLAAAGVPTGPVRTVPDALADAPIAEHPHPEGDGVVRTVALPWRLDDLPRAARRRAPRLGEHTEEVLRDWLGG